MHILIRGVYGPSICPVRDHRHLECPEACRAGRPVLCGYCAEAERNSRRHYPDIPLCVAGDLNMTLDGRRLPTIQCSDDLRQALADAGMRHVTRTLDYAIDHICLSLAWAERASDPLWWQTTYVGLTGGE